MSVGRQDWTAVMGSLVPRGHFHHGDVGYRFVLDRAVQRRSNRSALAFLIAVVESLIQCNPRRGAHY
jgi:hypothetical protein